MLLESVGCCCGAAKGGAGGAAGGGGSVGPACRGAPGEPSWCSELAASRGVRRAPGAAPPLSSDSRSALGGVAAAGGSPASSMACVSPPAACPDQGRGRRFASSPSARASPTVSGLFELCPNNVAKAQCSMGWLGRAGRCAQATGTAQKPACNGDVMASDAHAAPPRQPFLALPCTSLLGTVHIFSDFTGETLPFAGVEKVASD